MAWRVVFERFGLADVVAAEERLIGTATYHLYVEQDEAAGGRRVRGTLDPTSGSCLAPNLLASGLLLRLQFESELESRIELAAQLADGLLDFTSTDVHGIRRLLTMRARERLT